MSIILILILFLISVSISIFIFFKNKKNVAHSFSNSTEFTVLEVTISKLSTDTVDLKSSSVYAENTFISFHGLLHDELSNLDIISLEMTFSGTDGIKFYVTCKNEYVKFVESQIYAHHSSCTIKVVIDYTSLLNRESNYIKAVDLNLSKEYFFPIKTYKDFESDPLSSFTSALSNLEADDEFWFQIVIKPTPDTWQNLGLKYVKTIKEGMQWEKKSLFSYIAEAFKKELFDIIKNAILGFFVNPTNGVIKPQVKQAVKLSSAQEDVLNLIENKITKVGYLVNFRAVSFSSNEQKAQFNLRTFYAALKQYTGINYNSIELKPAINGLEEYKSRNFTLKSNLILNCEELATIYHFPFSNIETPNIKWEYSKLSEPPSNLPTKDCVFIGDTMFRNNKVRFGMFNPIGKNTDRLRHMYLVGKSGVGKSTLFQTMAIQDIKNGAGLCVLDPHGETIEKILDYIPDNRIDDVVYVDPSDEEMPVGLNLLELDKPENGNKLASGLLAAIKHHFDYSWGPRLEYLLNYSLLTLVQIKGTTMLSIVRLLTDKNYRNFIVHQINDPVLVKFWETEYKEYLTNNKFISEAISPIQNKVNRFLASSTMRNLLGQSKSTIDIYDCMQNKKILLLNLSKGKIGQDNANLLGALLVSRIQFYALQRAQILEEDRTPFYLYVDEFQNFATSSFGEILSESRKYGLGLYLTNQYTAQLSPEVLHAVLGNVGTIATFSAGSEDARVMAGEFNPFTAEDINTLKKFNIYIKLMIDGMSSLPFSARILLPWEDTEFLPPKTNNKEKVIKINREKYGVSREYVEAKIAKWVNMQFDKGMAISQLYRQKF